MSSNWSFSLANTMQRTMSSPGSGMFTTRPRVSGPRRGIFSKTRYLEKCDDCLPINIILDIRLKSSSSLERLSRIVPGSEFGQCGACSTITSNSRNSMEPMRLINSKLLFLDCQAVAWCVGHHELGQQKLCTYCDLLEIVMSVDNSAQHVSSPNLTSHWWNST